MVVPVLGFSLDGGKAIRVLSDRYRPDHSPLLINMAKGHGKTAQLIPRGAIFAYAWLMTFTWVVHGQAAN